MSDWLANLTGGSYAAALLWALGALVLLALVLVVWRIRRSRTSGTFVAGGRNRLPRLAVVDATAVDSQRRLVLVRRDEVEHLILIGGPTDVVIEPRIGGREAVAAAPQPPRREGVAPQVPPVPRPRPTPALRAVPPAAPPRPARSEPEPPQAPPARREEPQAAPRREPDPEPAAPMPNEEEDAALAKEIDASVEGVAKNEADEPEQQGATPSIEDEMSRLLDNLAEERKKEG